MKRMHAQKATEQAVKQQRQHGCKEETRREGKGRPEVQELEPKEDIRVETTKPKEDPMCGKPATDGKPPNRKPGNNEELPSRQPAIHGLEGVGTIRSMRFATLDAPA